MMSSQRRALTQVAPIEHEPVRPEASHAAGPDRLVGVPAAAGFRQRAL
jgi:hypothetical protein